MLRIRPDKSFRNAVALTKQWPTRTAKLRAEVAYTAAEVTREELLDRIPKQEEYKTYRQSLGVARISGAPGAFAVRANPSAHKVEKVDVFRTVLYIRARRRLGKVDPKVEVLERYNPWTPDTLPFVPKRRVGLTISRRVSLKESRMIADRRNRQRRKWKDELARVGVRAAKRMPSKLPKTLEAFPDVAFEALRLEFGLGDVKAQAHWRPTLRRLTLIGIANMIRRNPGLLKSQTKLSFSGWEKWPPPSIPVVSSAEARSYVPFQKMLGIKI